MVASWRSTINEEMCVSQVVGPAILWSTAEERTSDPVLLGQRDGVSIVHHIGERLPKPLNPDAQPTDAPLVAVDRVGDAGSERRTADLRDRLEQGILIVDGAVVMV